MEVINSIQIIPDQLVEECWQWALSADLISGDYYKKERGQGNSASRQKQFMNGKIGEFAFYQYFLSIGIIDISKPELKARRPTWHDPDLISISKNMNFHVKTSSKIREGGRSWSFEKSNILTTSPNDNDYLCFGSMLETNRIRIDTVTPAKFFVGQYKPSMIERLATKCCIYSKDFPELVALDFSKEKIELDEPLGF